MLKTKQLVAAAAIATFCTANVVGAEEKLILASLGDVSGKVLINKGQGFVTAKSGMEVRSGDRVIVLDSASAKIMYSDGCVTDLSENNFLAMDGNGCETKPVSPRTNHIKLAAALGATETDAGGPVGNTDAFDGTDGDAGGDRLGANFGGTVLLGIGGLVLVGGLMARDNNPVSAQ